MNRLVTTDKHNPSQHKTMKQPITLSIFFPTYNEEENIQETIVRTIRVVEDSPYVSAYEIIIVNDGSTDRTEKIAEMLSQQYPTVRVVTHATNLGYGAALKTGIQEARMEYVFFTDADLQFDIVELQSLLIHINNYPVVIGYRAPRRDSAMRLLNAWGWNKLNRLLFGLKVQDIDCAFKMFKRNKVQPLQLQSKGAMISAETLIRLTREDVPIKEVPVSHLPRIAGSPTGAKPSVIVRAFNEMILLYRGELGLTTHKEAFKFMTVGVVNTLLDVVVYIFLTRETVIFSHHLTVAKFLSFLVGTVSSLTLNRSWTFGLRTRLSWSEVVRFYAMTSISLTLNVAIMNFLVGFGMYDLLALAITTLFTFIAGFTLSRVWVFKRREQKRPALISQL
jgi:glycosyltransferase involved in cell wall biosynthesis